MIVCLWLTIAGIVIRRQGECEMRSIIWGRNRYYRAANYLEREYKSRASYQSRGALTKPQEEALNALWSVIDQANDRIKQLPLPWWRKPNRTPRRFDCN